MCANIFKLCELFYLHLNKLYLNSECNQISAPNLPEKITVSIEL